MAGNYLIQFRLVRMRYLPFTLIILLIKPIATFFLSWMLRWSCRTFYKIDLVYNQEKRITALLKSLGQKYRKEAGWLTSSWLLLRLRSYWCIVPNLKCGHCCNAFMRYTNGFVYSIRRQFIFSLIFSYWFIILLIVYI